jgi:hypothetical protein
MATVLMYFIPEEQGSVVLFCGQKDSIKMVFTKKCFMFTVGRVFRVKQFTSGSINSLKDVRKSQMIPNQLKKWLAQQSKDFYAAGFDALVKRWNKCISVGGEYVKKYMFFCQVI